MIKKDDVVIDFLEYYDGEIVSIKNSQGAMELTTEEWLWIVNVVSKLLEKY